MKVMQPEQMTADIDVEGRLHTPSVVTCVSPMGELNGDNRVAIDHLTHSCAGTLRCPNAHARWPENGRHAGTAEPL